jgi:hypothetical protein
MRKSQRAMTMFSLTLAATLVGFAGAAPAMAMGDDTGALNQVCLPLDSGKIDTTGDPMTVVLTAPEGMVITGYCVKAGSDNQGDGPKYPELRPEQLNQNSIEIAHPSGKAISHYSFSYAPAPTTPTDPVTPTKTIITEQPLPPTFKDECGYNNDRYDVPLYDPTKPYYYVTTTSADGLQVHVQVLPSLRHEFGPLVITTWDFEFVNNECGLPVFIVKQPEAPKIVDECGTANDSLALPADTDQLYYGMTGETVFAIEKAGFIFQQDLITSWPIAFTDVPCAVIPPIDEQPPVDVDTPEKEVPAPAEETVSEIVDGEPEAVTVAAEIESSSSDTVASLGGLDEAATAAEASETKDLANTGAGDLMVVVYAAVAAVLLGAIAFFGGAATKLPRLLARKK